MFKYSSRFVVKSVFFDSLGGLAHPFIYPFINYHITNFVNRLLDPVADRLYIPKSGADFANPTAGPKCRSSRVDPLVDHLVVYLLDPLVELISDPPRRNVLNHHVDFCLDPYRRYCRP